jgi:O-acetyl-ADP-ribose deacetylase (regulator of RNase III)
MKYDEDTMEVEGTLEQLTSLRQYLITRFGEERGISTVEQKQETLPQKTRQASHPYQQAGDIERDSKINYSRSSSRTYNSLAVKDVSYLTLEGLVVKVYVGNILHLNVDCIVNAANENLIHGGGVAEVISRAAGYDFQKESDDYLQNNGPLSVTECCITSAGNLQQYKCVIHAVGPKWYEYPIDKIACADDLQKTIVNCLKEAEMQNVSSVALPLISSGTIHYNNSTPLLKRPSLIQ